MAVFRAAEILTQELAVEIQVLNKQGRSIRQIARETGLAATADDWRLLWKLSDLAYDVFVDTGIMIQPVPVSSRD